MELDDILYASCLHVETLVNRNQTEFKLFKQTVSETDCVYRFHAYLRIISFFSIFFLLFDASPRPIH